ncbi:MAG: tetratricopeptide repeat protein [Reichenbachiella sp.]
MKKSAFFLLFLVSTLNGLCQSINKDSLWSVWENQSIPDTSRLNAMHDIAWSGYLFSQPDSAFLLAQLHFDFANKKMLKTHMAKALTIQGVSFALRSDYPAAISYINQSLNLSKETGAKKEIARSYTHIGNITRLQGNYDSSIYYHSRSLVLHTEIENKKGMATALGNIGIIYKGQGDFKKAMEFFERSLNIKQELNDKAGAAVTAYNIGTIYYHQGDFAKALAYYNQSLVVKEEIGENRGAAMIQRAIGILFENQDDLTKALEYYNSSLESFEIIGDKGGIANTLNSIGTILALQEELEPAMEFFMRSLNIRKEIGDRHGEAESYINIAAIYQENGAYDQALDYFKQSLAIYEENGNKKDLPETLNGIGITYKLKGDALLSSENSFASSNAYTSAVRYSTRALKLAQEIGKRKETMNAAYTLYELYKSINQPKLSLEMHEVYLTERDSILDIENQTALLKQTFKNEMKQQHDSLENIQQSQKNQFESEINKRKVLQNVGLGAILVLIALLYIGYRYYHLKKQANLTLQENNTKIRNQKEQLEVLNQEKNKLIGMVAHDLRSPLNSVKGLLNIIKDEPNKAEKERFMELILNSTDRMTEMVDRILDVSTLESKTLQLNIEKVDLVSLVNDLMINFIVIADEKKQQMQLVSKCAAATVAIDKNYFIQVLENLVSNAIKYSDFATEISITLDQVDKDFRLTVQDHGQGISEEEQKKLFREFSTLSSKSTGGEKSTGLGLSIAKKYVEAMKGEIWCESKLNEGSRFILQFNGV